MRRAGAILREAAVSAVSQKSVSALTVVVVAALCLSVLLTAGRSEGSATAVLSSIDASGTRSIIVRAQAGSGLDTGVLQRLQGVGLIDWVGAFGYADDVTNVAVPGGQRVSLRRVYTDVLPVAEAAPVGVATVGVATVGVAPVGVSAVASPAAARALGFSQRVGTVVSAASGATFDVVGMQELSPDLRFLEPVLLVPASAPSVHPVDPLPAPSRSRPAASARGTSPASAPSVVAPEPAADPEPSAGLKSVVDPNPAASPNSAADPEPVAVLVVRAVSPAAVGAVARLVTSVLAVDDPTTVTVETSERLADVRRQVETQLGDFGRALVLSVFAGASALIAAILFALVVLRRRDFGRRRALGASRSLIAALLLVQVGLLATLGTVLAAAIALLSLAVTAQPQPSAPFTLAVCLLAVMISIGAALVPAAVASTRDPLRELRIP